MHCGHFGIICRMVCFRLSFEQRSYDFDPIDLGIFLLALGHVATEAGVHQRREFIFVL